MLESFIISGYINAVTTLILGLFAFIRNRKSEAHVTFGLMSLVISLWSVSYAFWLSSNTSSHALFWVKSLAFFATFIPVFYYHWVLNILNKEKSRRQLLILSYFLTFFLAFLIFSPFYVTNVEQKMIFPFWPNGTFLYLLYIMFLYIGVASLGLFELITQYKVVSNRQRNQIKYLILGSLIGFLGGFTNFFLWFDIGIYPVGNFLVFIYVFILGYAMLKHRLMDIKFIVVRSLTYFILLALFGFLYMLTIFIFGGLIFGQFTGKEAYWASMIIALLVGFTFYPLKRSFTKWTDKIFFKDRYNFEELTSKLNETATSTIILPELLFKFLNLLVDEMRVDRGAFVLLEKNKIYESQTLGYKQVLNLEKSDIEHLSRERKIEVFDEAEEGSICKDIMRRHDAVIILPLIAENDLIGLLFLGEKKSGDAYSQKDIEVLKIVSNQLALGIQNAKAYEQVQKFNFTLRAEINRATRETKDTNVKLVELDKSKDEFISLASHEIRTPIATLEGYLSILVNQKLELKDQKDILNRAYDSIGRLAVLAKDLLDTSRIDQERMVINKELTRLEVLIERVVEGFEFRAKEKGIFVKYKKAEKMLPEVNIDPERINEVFNNIIGNAIKFTHKGGITISVKLKDKDSVLVSISDTGEGIPKDDIPNLFKKFYQAQTASSILSKDKGGTGLGLYITKNIVDIHGGKIWIESRLRRGTTFFFTLPIK